MKNILKSSLYLLVFAGAGILFQISCSANSDDNAPQNLPPTGRIIFAKNTYTEGVKIFTCNYDGSEQTEIVLSLPNDIRIFDGASQHATPRISPDGQKIFFLTYNPSNNNQTSIYSANIDGSSPMEIVDGAGGQLELGNLN